MPRPPEGATGISSGALMSEVSAHAINGPRIFVVTAVTDIGYLINRFDRAPDAAPMRSCMVEGFIAEQDSAVKVNRDTRLSFDERSNLIAFITATRGGQKPDDEEQVDPGEIVGVPIQVTVESTARKRDGGYWLALKAPSALMEGVTIPTCITEIEIPARRSFVWKTDEELASIRASLGAASPAQGGGGSEPYDPQDDRPPFDESDEPF